MKLSKTKKILLLGITLGTLTASIVTPIVLLNKNKDNDEKDINKVFKILEEKKDKTIILASDSTKKIIGNNQGKIVTKLKKIIGDENLKEVKIEVLMVNDTNISTTPQKIIIKLTKNEISREIKDFLVKRDFTTSELANKDILSIKNILDGKTNEDLIIILPSNSTGNIIGKVTNKNEIIKKLRQLIDPSNTNGDSTHSSLRGTSIEISMNNDTPISTTSQNIIVSISKTGGITLSTTKIFKVKKASSDDEDIQAIKRILESKIGNDLIITLPSDTNGLIIDNENAIKKKLRILIDPSNINGEANHSSLRGVNFAISSNGSISTTPQDIIVSISKSGGRTLTTRKTFQVKRAFTTSELANKDIKAIWKILDNKTGQDLIIILPSSSTGFIIQNRTNKNEIIKKLRILIDPSNTNGEANHSSLKGTIIEILISTADKIISTTSQYIEIYIFKKGGKTLSIRDKFQVKKESTSK